MVLKILSEGKRNISHIQEFVIQPQSEIASVREFLQENEYSIVGESMVMEEDKYYTIIKAVRGKMKSYEPVCKKYGKYLLENKDKVLFEYLLWEKKLLTNIMTDLIKNVTQNTIKRVSEIEDALALIEEAFLFYEKDI